jgi:hypothetical protein
VLLRTGGNQAAKGLRVLQFVCNNAASRQAFRLARQLLRVDADTLHLVHVVPLADMFRGSGEQLLASFADAAAEPHIRRRAVQQGDARLLEVCKAQSVKYHMPCWFKALSVPAGCDLAGLSRATI